MEETNVTFRVAGREDAGLILEFIKKLADYEHMTEEVVATEELLTEWIFDKGKAEVLFAVAEGQEVGFALFSTTSLRFSEGQAYIWKTCMYWKKSEAGGTAGRCLHSWLELLQSGDAEGWNGPAWTGMSLA